MEETLLMDISEQLRCLFSAHVEEQDGSYQLEVPSQEIHRGDIQPGETYRVAILSSPGDDGNEDMDTNGEHKGIDTEPEREQGTPEPPVEEGETRDVEIEDIGDQGDGITRVERGFVVIVPETEKGEQVTINITDVRENVAFAGVIDRLSYDE